jgi:intracellular sulfur oxidation DsrE/DsrF family protein
MTTAIIINNRTLGHGDAELGERLMGSFLRKLWGQAEKPKEIVFYNTGVLLLAEGSAVLDALTELERAGVDLIACGTCVAHFDL